MADSGAAVAQRLRNRHLIGRATPSVQMDCCVATADAKQQNRLLHGNG